MAIPKKKLQAIKHISVMDDVLRETLNDEYFADSPPDTWNRDEALLYDIAAEIEYKVLKKVEEVLLAETPLKKRR